MARLRLLASDDDGDVERDLHDQHLRDRGEQSQGVEDPDRDDGTNYYVEMRKGIGFDALLGATPTS